MSTKPTPVTSVTSKTARKAASKAAPKAVSPSATKASSKPSQQATSNAAAGEKAKVKPKPSANTKADAKPIAKSISKPGAKPSGKFEVKSATKGAVQAMVKSLASKRPLEPLSREEKREQEKAQRMKNGDELRELLASTGLTIEDAVDAFNKGQARPVSVSAFKSWLSASDSSRRRGMPDAAYAHAKAVLSQHTAAQQESA